MEIKDNNEFLMAKSSYLAHEMKNILAICRLYSEIIEKQVDKIEFKDEKVKKSFENAISCISKSVNMGSNLVLDFRSMGENKIEKISLAKLIDNVFKMSEVYTEDKKITFTNCNKLDVKVLVDETKIMSVLINIIKNAIESIECEGEVLVTTNEYDDSIKIRISNTGKPIGKSLQAKIFKEGFTTKENGNGLGLAICKRTLEQMDGELRLVKSDKESTDFEISVLKNV